MAADLPPAAPADAPPAVAARAPVAAEVINVDSHDYHYTVTGNTLLPREKIVQAIEGAPGPKEALDAVNKAYVDAGYFLIVIGGQVEKKLVAFRILQGRITEIDAPDALRPFLRRLLERDDLTTNTMIRESAMAELYAAREGMKPKATFSPAPEEGGTKLTVTEEPIPDAKRWSAGLALNNLGGRFASRYTWGASGAVRPGGGVELTGNYVQGIPRLTPESRGSSYQAGQVGATIVTPWGVYGVNLAQTKYQIGEVGAPYFPAGLIQYGGISGSQIVYADASSRVAVNEGVTWYANGQTVFDGLFTLVDQVYTVGSVGGSYNRTFAFLEKNSSFGASLTVQKGFTPRGGSFLPAEAGVPDPHFLLGQATVSAVLQLPYGMSAGASISGQYTSYVLPQSQQWVLGGFGNLSAWLPAVLIGDSGALGRISLSSPPWQWNELSMSAGAYAEAGMSRLEQRAVGDAATRALGDAGVQIQANWSKGTTLTFAYAWPVYYRNIYGVVRDNVDRERANLYFTLSQSF